MKKNIIKRTVIAALLGVVIGALQFVVLAPTDQVTIPSLGVAQMNGGNTEVLMLRGMQGVKNNLAVAAGVLYALVGLWWLFGIIKHVRASQVSPLLFALLPLGMASCMKSYDTPEYVEVSNNETAFVFPLEGDTKDQDRFQSKEYLQQSKVAAKRIQITHRWNQTGRMSNSGEWIPSIRVIKVDRSPITRNWHASEENGHQVRGATSDQAIWVESADSVGFSMGFACTAYVTEQDSATFLYWYPSGSLTSVMDTEIRARVQQGAAEVSAKYPLDELRGKKQEIIDTIRKDVTEFFKERGITITTVGMFGGMTYENTKIQNAIDDVFIAQQEKEKAQAAFEAQQKQNETIKLAAEAAAEKKRIEAEGEAKAIDLVRQALENAGPLYIQREFISRWDGKFPEYFVGGTNPSMLLGLPPVGTGTK